MNNDDRDFLTDKLGEFAADILSAARQPVSLEAQIEASKKLRNRLTSNEILADKARAILVDEYGTDRADEIIRTFDAKSAANLTIAIARGIIGDGHRLALPVMNFRQRKDKDDGVLRPPEMRFEEGRK